jgi:hypothetical protein
LRKPCHWVVRGGGVDQVSQRDKAAARSQHKPALEASGTSIER